LGQPSGHRSCQRREAKAWAKGASHRSVAFADRNQRDRQHPEDTSYRCISVVARLLASLSGSRPEPARHCQKGQHEPLFRYRSPAAEAIDVDKVGNYFSPAIKTVGFGETLFANSSFSAADAGNFHPRSLSETCERK